MPRANPVRLAGEWKRAMEERGESRADLARRLGISRARVTQVLSVLDLSPEALDLLEHQSGPGIMSERNSEASRSCRRSDKASGRSRGLAVKRGSSARSWSNSYRLKSAGKCVGLG